MRRTSMPAAARRWRPRALAATLTTVALLAVGLAVPAAASAADDGPLSGVYGRGGRVASVTEFGDWRGRDVDVVQDFVDGTSWRTLSDPWIVEQWAGRGYEMSYSVPMLPASGGSMSRGAAGEYNTYFRQLAQHLVDNGQRDAILRLGWEMNGDWFRWSAVPDADTYVAYWRQIVRAMRSVDGEAFRFEWAPNPGAGTSGFDKVSAYPGDSYVDLIGTSLYNQSWSYSPDQREERWNRFVTMPYGLQWSVDFAKAHGKRNSMPEWGLTYRCDGNGGNDDPYFIEQLSKWFTTHDYYYETYFNYTGGTLCEQTHSLYSSRFPKAAAAYKTIFGTGATNTPDESDPVTDPDPAPSAGGTVDGRVLKVSWLSTRLGALPLSWMGVSSSRVYIHAKPTFDVERVRFYLDDTDASGTPIGTDSTAPYDMRGGTSTNAVPWDARPLSPGKHTMTAVFDLPGGGTRTATVTFLSS
ncbi:glycosyl hydrolase [Cellulomonas marina]|uniref:Glycosyl hydrolase family 26 n=1 Tax=Cellulomonas marina TaxID=988821 RepID=A0A1I0X201_9CELL|nr:glycosyl hydrolase [Cellulomonas marina]GIG29353.1 hypothetical protein Cma02nite_19530 [Cellulomonas marina]SFA94408.1 Glycosyl hydrolase family 26 [Cellulomonas marina]